ncbi:uncharacterized protein LOC101896961 [Musca domestica]|uniref:Uncharacterized protein LOC101896961 n=1 Tax=Musca domestica TaxID=7370 RepID=A0ABM3VF38_MUSDO|nr:uncharacterized protein LOC101896961 [Musca domestica]
MVNNLKTDIKFFIVALAFVACAYADVSELGYNYNQQHHAHHEHHVHHEVAAQPQNSYIPPAPVAPVAPVNTYVPPAPVAPVNTYVPPAPVQIHPGPAPVVHEPVNTYIPPASVNPVEEIVQTPSDGYHYKTARRVVYRHRA